MFLLLFDYIGSKIFNCFHDENLNPDGVVCSNLSKFLDLSTFPDPCCLSLYQDRV